MKIDCEDSANFPNILSFSIFIILFLGLNYFRGRESVRAKIFFLNNISGVKIISGVGKFEGRESSTDCGLFGISFADYLESVCGLFS